MPVWCIVAFLYIEPMQCVCRTEKRPSKLKENLLILEVKDDYKHDKQNVSDIR